MIRAETSDAWILITHPDHAALAGAFAGAWGNARFPRPEPFGDIHYAVAHHDDGWRSRDAAPTLTRDGRPEAFTRSLVGAYAAFEEIDLPHYLAVRGAATAAVAEANPFAGILVSMHTVNLLTEQADASTIRPEHRPAYAAFLAEQRAWQAATASRLGADSAALQRGFEFLQCCDNLSLIACSGYDQAVNLRHAQPDTVGARHLLRCESIGASCWSIRPWPFAPGPLQFRLPYRTVPKASCRDTLSLRDAFAAARPETRLVTLMSGD
jgi:hypothetical protein